ncbi:hypothetical protein B0H13DRAFT_2005027 [Mycena leptocephala]|nr:hypothetical protein B0H13DRAFT_2005027 [Mycena leptocephala]
MCVHLIFALFDIDSRLQEYIRREALLGPAALDGWLVRAFDISRERDLGLCTTEAEFCSRILSLSSVFSSFGMHICSFSWCLMIVFSAAYSSSRSIILGLLRKPFRSSRSNNMGLIMLGSVPSRSNCRQFCPSRKLVIEANKIPGSVATAEPRGQVQKETMVEL